MRIEWGNLGNRITRTPHLAGALAVVLCVCIAILNLYTGPAASLLLLYLIPISIAAVGVGDRFAGGLCLVVTLLATAIRLDGGPMTPSEVWNAATRLAVLLCWALLVGRLRTHPGAAHAVGQIGRAMTVVVAIGLLAAGTLSLVQQRSLGPTSARPTGPLAELTDKLQECIEHSRPLLLGSRDPAGPSCVTFIPAGSVQNEMPSNIADYNGGPGTTMTALYFFDRAGVTRPVDDYIWHQTRLRRFLENQLAVNARAARHATDLARLASAMSERLDDARSIPASLRPVGFTDGNTWIGYCLTSLDSSLALKDLAGAQRWADELASAAFALDDLHRWLGLLVQNQLQILEFQKLNATAYTDPGSAPPTYDLRTAGSYFPGGMLSLNGITNYLEVERQAEELFAIPADWAPALSTGKSPKHGAIWLPPGVRDTYLTLYETLAETNRKTLKQATRSPYNRSYVASMLFRVWKSNTATALAVALRRFDNAHPNASADELMDALMIRGHAFSGVEWGDRFQPQLALELPGLSESDLSGFLAAGQWTAMFNAQRQGYGMTFTLREALARQIFDCVRATDMIAALHRNSGGTGASFVNWSAGSVAHSVGAFLDTYNGEARTMVLDALMHAPSLQAWPQAYFAGAAWPPGLEGSPNPYSTELYGRGIDNYIWLGGYVVKGPHAGTLSRAAIPYLPNRNLTETRKVYQGPYPQ